MSETPSGLPLTAIGAVLAGSAVGAGAFGAHGLEYRLTADQLGWWQTAVQYQMWHALALVVLGLSGRVEVRLPAFFLLGGMLIFSGTLFAMALGAPRWLGAVTPIGGLGLVLGWILLAWRGFRIRA